MKVISQVFHDCKGVENISDDIVVHGKNLVEHNERLESAMNRIREKNLNLNNEECQFTMDNITFMGHVLSKNGIGPTSERFEAIANATQPSIASEVRSFLGVVNFSARYIPNLATLADPLRQSTKKNVKFTWEKKQQDSFAKLKECLTSVETLGYFGLDATRTQMVTDASDVGLGAVLLQEYDGQTKVISYSSRTLSEAERKYSTTEKEGLASSVGV